MKEPSKNAVRKIGLGAAALGAAASPASAFIVAGENGSEQANDLDSLQKRHSEFQYKDNVVRMGGGTGIYLGDDGNVGYLLTAGHLGSGIGSVEVNGVTFATHDSRPIGNGDLRLFEIGGHAGDPTLPSLPSVNIIDRDVNVGEDVIMLGRGTRIEISDGNGNTSDATISTNGGRDYYTWGPVSDTITWAENSVAMLPRSLRGDSNSVGQWSANPNYSEQNVFFTRFDDPYFEYDKSYEGHAAGGDSGGPAFIRDSSSGEYLLAGITHGVDLHDGQDARTAAFGNRTAYVNLADYADELPSLKSGVTSVPETSTALLGMAGTIALSMRRKRDDDEEDENTTVETR